jgi:hypothetical protein
MLLYRNADADLFSGEVKQRDVAVARKSFFETLAEFLSHSAIS